MDDGPGIKLPGCPVIPVPVSGDEDLRAMAMSRMRVGTWLRGGLPPNHDTRLIRGRVECCGEVLEVERELDPHESITLAWRAVQQELASRYVQHWHAVMDAGRLPV